MKAKRAAIYVRVSTAEQETDLQETELKEIARIGAGVAAFTEIKDRAGPRTTGQH